VMVFLLHVGRLSLTISLIVSRNRVLCEAAYRVWTEKNSVLGLGFSWGGVTSVGASLLYPALGANPMGQFFRSVLFGN